MENREKLIELLSKQPELTEKLLKALECERFFILITYQHVIDPEQPQNDLQHYWRQDKFDDNDVLPSIQHITADWTAKKRPNAAIPNDGNWH